MTITTAKTAVLSTFGALLLAAALAASAGAQGSPGGGSPGGGAQGDILGQGGKRGASAIPRGACKYGNNGLNGFLRTSAVPPAVSGANVRRRAGDVTRARYRAYLVDASQGHATLEVSGWSGWLRVREGRGSTWQGETAFSGGWRGNYRMDVRIEWWRSGRLVGWRAYRITTYNYFDQYNRGPNGPLSSCYKPQGY